MPALKSVGLVSPLIIRYPSLGVVSRRLAVTLYIPTCLTMRLVGACSVKLTKLWTCLQFNVHMVVVDSYVYAT